MTEPADELRPQKPDGHRADHTSLVLRLAKDGRDQVVLDWIRRRFLPVAELNARRCAEAAARDEHVAQSLAIDAVELLVQRLGTIDPASNGRITPVAMRFLFTTVKNLARNAARRERPHERHEPIRRTSDGDEASRGVEPVDSVTSIWGLSLAHVAAGITAVARDFLNSDGAALMPNLMTAASRLGRLSELRRLKRNSNSSQ